MQAGEETEGLPPVEAAWVPLHSGESHTAPVEAAWFLVAHYNSHQFPGKWRAAYCMQCISYNTNPSFLPDPSVSTVFTSQLEINSSLYSTGII